MSVPEATVDEDHLASCREHKIGAPGKVAHMQTKAIAESVQQSAYCMLRFCIFASYRPHNVGAFLMREDIRHIMRLIFSSVSPCLPACTSS